jgi:hypothetical protein
MKALACINYRMNKSTESAGIAIVFLPVVFRYAGQLISNRE